MPALISFSPEAVVWQDHPLFVGVRIAWLVSGALSDGPYTCALVEMADDAVVPEHVHQNEDDVLYVLKGRARMEICGAPEVELRPGSFLRVPKNTRHRPFDFSGGFTIYDFWATNP